MAENTQTKQTMLAVAGEGGATFNAFDICDLSGFEEESYPFFVPIVIKSAQIIGEGAADSIDGLHIVLPLNPGKITDSVSVSFNRRIDNTAGSTIATMLSEKVLSSFGEFSLSPDLQNMLLYNYDARSLRKEIQIPYIIPIQKNIDINRLRKGLTVLQGLVYPRYHGLTYPPFVSITIGGMYNKLKGFISQVSVEFDENITIISGVKFPILITGTIQFICLHSFTWNSVGIDFGSEIAENVKEEFVLLNKSLLFGKDVDSNYSPDNNNLNKTESGLPNVTSDNKSKFDSTPEEVLNNKSIAKQNETLNSLKLNKTLSAVTQNNLNTTLNAYSNGINEIDTSQYNTNDFLNKSFSSIDENLLEKIEKIAILQNIIKANLNNYGSLDSLGIDLSDNNIIDSLDNVMNKLNSLTSNYEIQTFLTSLKSNNRIKNVNNLFNSCQTTIVSDIMNCSNKLNNVLENNLNTFNILNFDTFDSVDNIFMYTKDIEGYEKQVEELISFKEVSNPSGLKELMVNNTITNSIRINNTLNLLNDLYENNNKMIDITKDDFEAQTICKIPFIFNNILSGVIIYKLCELQKELSKNLLELVIIEYNNNNLNYAYTEYAENSYNSINLLSPSNMNRSINVIHDNSRELLKDVIF